MNTTRISLVPALLLLLALGAALRVPELSAQSRTPAGWTVVPQVGFGLVFVGESRNSGGLETALELEYGGPRWRIGGLGSVRGLGVGCSEACFDGGPAAAATLSWGFGPLWVGGGYGAMRQFGSWSALPFGRASFQGARVRVEARMEFPQATGSGTYVPLLVGFPLPAHPR